MVQDLFVRGQASPPVGSNCPPRAGTESLARCRFANMLVRGACTACRAGLRARDCLNVGMRMCLLLSASSWPACDLMWIPFTSAGAVVWVRGLMGRLDDPVMRFRGMGHNIVESEEGVEAFRAYEAIMRSMIEFEEKQVSCGCRYAFSRVLAFVGVCTCRCIWMVFS